MPRAPRKPRAKKPKRVKREWFTATIERTGLFARLDLKRGCQRVTLDVMKDGIGLEQLETDSSKVLRANRGDHLVLCGPAVDEIQDAVVVRIEPADRTEKLVVELGYGLLHPTTTTVRVLRGMRAA
jgi:hypothetical protein